MRNATRCCSGSLLGASAYSQYLVVKGCVNHRLLRSCVSLCCPRHASAASTLLRPQPMLAVRARQGGPANRLPLHQFLRLIAGHGRMMEHGERPLGCGAPGAALASKGRAGCQPGNAACVPRAMPGPTPLLPAALVL